MTHNPNTQEESKQISKSIDSVLPSTLIRKHGDELHPNLFVNEKLNTKNGMKKYQISVALKDSTHVLILVVELDSPVPSYVECPFMLECIEKKYPRDIRAFSQDIQRLTGDRKKVIFFMTLEETSDEVYISVEENEPIMGKLICCTIRCPVEPELDCGKHNILPCLPRSQKGPILKIIRQIASQRDLYK